MREYDTVVSGRDVPASHVHRIRRSFLDTVDGRERAMAEVAGAFVRSMIELSRDPGLLDWRTMRFEVVRVDAEYEQWKWSVWQKAR